MANVDVRDMEIPMAAETTEPEQEEGNVMKAILIGSIQWEQLGKVFNVL